jgi:hypothetical protein
MMSYTTTDTNYVLYDRWYWWCLIRPLILMMSFTTADTDDVLYDHWYWWCLIRPLILIVSPLYCYWYWSDMYYTMAEPVMPSLILVVSLTRLGLIGSLVCHHWYWRTVTHMAYVTTLTYIITPVKCHNINDVLQYHNPNDIRINFIGICHNTTDIP